MSTDKKLAEGHIFTAQPDGVMRQDYLFRVSIKAVIYNDDGELLVVKEHGLNWGLPGGGLDFGETFEQALARELEEEVGYRGGFTFDVIDVANPNIAVDNLGARVKTILFPRGKEYCIADRETEGNYCRSRLAVVSLVSLSLESGYVDLSAAVGGTKDYSYHSGLAEDAIGRKVSLIYPNTFISAPEEFSYGLISVRGWAKKSGIGVVPELKKKRRKESELTTGETRLISSGVISVAVAAVMELSSDELKQASEQGLELSAEEIRGLCSDFKCSIYDT